MQVFTKQRCLCRNNVETTYFTFVGKNWNLNKQKEEEEEEVRVLHNVK